MPIEIRSAEPEDEEPVTALWAKCGLVVSYNDPAVDFRFAKAGACSDVLVGVAERGEIAAAIMVGHDGHRGWLYYVATAPELRGRGIARQMIQAAEHWLRQRNVRKVQLMVRDTNAPVVSFYERLGYEISPRIVMARWL